MIGNPSKALIWILEDHPDLLNYMGCVGKEYGFETKLLSSLKEAWSISELPDQKMPDVIVSDFNLGDGNATGWLTTMHVQYPTAKIICVSGSVELELSELIQKLGARIYSKPYDIEKLFQQIRQAVL